MNLHGNVLSIYGKSDLAQSCQNYRTDATGISEWKEVEVNRGLKHGFPYRPMKEWTEPTIAWAKKRFFIFTLSVDGRQTNSFDPNRPAGQ